MSQREIRITVPALQSIPVRAAGDFIFCQAAARPVTVRLNEQALTMRAGDKRRIERRPNDPKNPAFDIFELDNSASALPLAVTLIVGVGDFNSQIVSGELIVAPGIQTADGAYRTDTRHDLKLNIAVKKFAETADVSGDLKISGSGSPSGTKGPFTRVGDAYSGKILAIRSSSATNIEVFSSIGVYEGAITPTLFGGGSMPSLSPAAMKWDGRNKVYLTDQSKLRVIDTETNFYREWAQVGHGLGPGTFTDSFIKDGELWQAFTATTPAPDETYILRCTLPQGVGDTFDLIEIIAVPWNGIAGVSSKASVVGMCFIERTQRLLLGIAGGANYMIDMYRNAEGTFTIGGRCETEFTSSARPTGGRCEYIEKENLIFLGTNTNPEARKLENLTYYGEGFASSESYGAMIEPESWNKLFRAVDRVEYGSRVGMAGAVIAAIYELATGESAPADYLDYVYGINYFDAQVNRWRTLTSGGESFMAANVADNFVIMVPGAIVLTVRNGLF
jgi:hypothetical protein